MENIEVMEQTENKDLATALAGLEFESADARLARKALDAAKIKVAELSEKAAAFDKQDNAQKKAATRLATRLLKEGISVEAVVAAMQKEYGRVRKAMPTGDARKSHKLEQDIQGKILGFVTEHANGISAKEIWGAFANNDKQGVSIVVKRLVDENKIRAVGNTRQRKYFPVV